MKQFSRYNPLVNLIFLMLFYFLVIFSQSIMCQVISFTLINLLLFCYEKGVNLLKILTKSIIFALIVSLVNVMFNHQGATIIWYFKSGNPLTLESVLYGVYSGLMFINIINLSKFSNILLTTDKIIYLFGKISPSFALLISMCMKYFESFKRQFIEIYHSRKINEPKNGAIQNFKSALNAVSIMITYSLESSINTANSMKNRGFSTGKRTNYNNFCFNKYDFNLLLIIVLNFSFFIIIYLFCEVENQFFPIFISNVGGNVLILLLISIIFFGCIPIALKLVEDYRWR